MREEGGIIGGEQTTVTRVVEASRGIVLVEHFEHRRKVWRERSRHPDASLKTKEFKSSDRKCGLFACNPVASGNGKRLNFIERFNLREEGWLPAPITHMNSHLNDDDSGTTITRSVIAFNLRDNYCN